MTGRAIRDEWEALTDQIPAHLARVRHLLAIYDNATRGAAR